MTHSLCDQCARMREVISGKGSRFLLCQLSRVNPHYPKYPNQPVLRCLGFIEVEMTERE